ncbi:MAG: leucine-rich repeat domain-containing protein, partial [Muribaculaceae bacterium]|nr:leucine-rich repeat domain-containing protein [Muribaculaceae bacterium]
MVVDENGFPVRTGVILGVVNGGDPDQPSIVVSVPTYITEYTVPESVTVINKDAFDGCENLTTVIIPEGSKLEIIGEAAFEGCKNLETIEIPEGVTSIGDNAFSGSGIKNITIPSTGTEIGDGAFSGCENLESVELPADGRLESIGEGAFSDTAIKEIKIPDTVNNLGGGAFQGCGNLETVILGDGVREVPDNLFSETGNESLKNIFVSENVDVKLPESVEEQVKVIEYPHGIELIFEEKKDENGEVVTDENGNPVKTGVILGYEKGADPEHPTVLVSVPADATEYTLPESVTTINKGAFEGCENLTAVTIPEGAKLETIGEGAFEGCKSLETVKIPEGVTTIGD